MTTTVNDFAPEGTRIEFELGVGITLDVWDSEELPDGTVRINLAPEYEHATLSGTAPEDYVRLAERILTYALSDDSGDWMGWDEENARVAERARRALAVLADTSIEPA